MSKQAEKLFAPLAKAPLDEAFNVLQPAMQDDINVHRFVFAHRTYGLADLLGKDYAYTILRQCVRFCCDHEQGRISRNNPPSPIRALMPKLLDQYKLAGKQLGTRDPGDAAVEELARTIYQGPPEKSAEAVAAALAEGISPEVVGEAISLASNLLVLRQGPDEWRTHGDSAGVHSSDATNAWRNMARMSQPMHALTGLIVAAYHVAAHKPFSGEPIRRPSTARRSRRAMPKACWPKRKTPCGTTTRAAPRRRSPSTARRASRRSRSTHRMLKYTISEDGRLHGEKYFHTVQEEYRTTRPAFRWRQIVGLARVTASAYGYDREDKHGGRAPGYEEACRLLKVTA